MAEFRRQRESLFRLSLVSLVASIVCGTTVAQTQTQAQPQANAALKEMVITASGFEQDIKDAPASITVIDRKELEQKRFSSLAEALTDVEGVDVGAAAGKTGGLNISIRGMPSDYTLVLIDGRRQTAAGSVTPTGFGETQTSFMPPVSAIERIEIIRGPMSTLYGSDAMGGVINIITRKVSREWTGSVNTDYTFQQEAGFGDTRSAKAYLSGPIKQDVLGLSIRASTFKRDAASVSYENVSGTTVVPTMGANPVEATINTLGLRFALTPTKDHDLTLDLDTARQTYDNSRGQLGTQTVQGGYAPEQRYNRDQYTIAHTGRFSFGRWETSFMNNETETIGRTIPPGTPGAITGVPRILEVQSRVIDSKLVTSLGNHLITVGGQWWDANMKDGVAPGNFEFTQKALFAEDEWRITERLGLTFGARYDRHSVFGGKVSPRVYGVFNATERWTVKGGISNGYKTPRVEQLAPGINGFGGQGTIPLVGSPGLKPETSTSTELGALYDNQNGFTFGVTVFNNEFDDKITSGPGLVNCSFAATPNRPGCVDFGFWPNVDAFGQSINVDKAVTSGLELSTRIPLSRTLSLRGNYTYTDSEQQSGPNIGKPLGDTPQHSLNASLNWQATDKLNAWARAEYRSERFRDPGTTAASRAAVAQLGDYRAYTQLHIGGSYRPTNKWTLSAAVYNVFNKNFVQYTAYRVSPTTVNYSNLYVNNQDGRRLWLSANYEF